MDFKQQLAKYQRDVGEQLCRFFPKKVYPEVIFESMEYSLMGKSKRIRPILLLQSALCAGGTLEDVVHLMVAIEMIHTYSLIHDDLPAMDNDDLRRGVPTNHIVYGEATAILSGDGLLNLAFETMLSGAKIAQNKGAYISAMDSIASASGVYGMIGGQVADMCSEGKEADAKTLAYIHSHKTGALLRASCVAGAVALAADESVVLALSQYGSYVGLMFQIVDDILDVVGDKEKMGKNIGMDINKMTYPHVYGMEASVKKVDSLYEEAMDSLAPLGDEADFLRSLAKYLTERKS